MMLRKYSLVPVILILFFIPVKAGFSPVKDFDPELLLRGPNYSDLACWAAHPARHGTADSIPSFLKDEKRDTGVDVFFLHPTSYTGTFKGWNADIHDEEINRKTDAGSILFQASVFNASARIFAPRYRQAHLNAFYTRDTAAARAALDLAYEDLKNAFQYYLDHWNHGRPIIIASHSQGTVHGIRLLKEFFDGKPLQKQLVCAYLVGYRIKKGAFKHIPAGESPGATGCVVGWRSYRPGYIPPFVKQEKGDCICTNPVTWTSASGWSPKERHPGFLGRNFNKVLKPHAIRAEIAPGNDILWVDVPVLAIKLAKNYHIGDYNLFYLNIRQNVKDRVAAFKK